jgi:hypothetical protein
MCSLIAYWTQYASSSMSSLLSLNALRAPQNVAPERPRLPRDGDRTRSPLKILVPNNLGMVDLGKMYRYTTFCGTMSLLAGTNVTSLSRISRKNLDRVYHFHRVLFVITIAIAFLSPAGMGTCCANIELRLAFV